MCLRVQCNVVACGVPSSSLRCQSSVPQPPGFLSPQRPLPPTVQYWYSIVVCALYWTLPVNRSVTLDMTAVTVGSELRTLHAIYTRPGLLIKSPARAFFDCWIDWPDCGFPLESQLAGMYRYGTI